MRFSRKSPGAVAWEVETAVQAVALAIALVVLGSPALAAAGADACPDIPGTDEQRRQIAGEWFSKGERLVADEKYEDALNAFLCSLKMVEHPATVFNAAQAANAAGNVVVAKALLSQYLAAAPDGDMAPEAKQLLEKLEKDESAAIAPSPPPSETGAAEEPKAGDGNPEETPDGAASGDAAEPADEDAGGGRFTMSTAGYIALGVGGAALIAGGVLQILAAVAKSDAGSASDYGDFEDRRSAMEGYQLGAIICFASGGAIAATGLTLVLVDRREKPAAAVSLLPGPRGLALRLTF